MRKEETGRRARGRNAANRVHDPPQAGKSGRSTKKSAAASCRETEDIRNWLKQVRFHKAVFGGVDEADVWKKIGELNTLYEQALAAERMRYDALLEERVRTAARLIVRKYGADGHPKEAGDVPYE